MKTLILVLLLASPLFANKLECETELSMFQSNIEQSNPITDEQLITAIDSCEDVVGYEGFVSIMQLMLETTIEV
jgi:hypothetical protein